MEEKIKKMDGLRNTMMGFHSFWAQTSSQWQDNQRVYFQRQFIDQISNQTKPTLKAWDQLMEVIKNAEDQLKK